MAATSLRLLSAAAALLLLLLPSAASAFSGVHDLLKEYGLPKGLLPHSAKHYSLSDDGELVVQLKHPCYVHFSDLVYYDQIVRGKLSYGAISDLSGVQVKKLFVWLTVSAIEARPESGTIDFKVGFLSLSFPADEFMYVPKCTKEAAAGLAPDEEPLLLPVAEV